MSLFLFVFLVMAVVSQPSSQNTCSSYIPHFNTPTASSNCETFRSGKSYNYPNDFKYLNSHQWYECPTSGYRIVVSNNIPDHDVSVNNPNEPCEIPIYIRLPLNATYSSSIIEPSNLGIIAVQLNGVIIYGAQENGGTNAVEPGASGQVQDAQYWYGHTDQNHNWHYHNPFIGHSVQPQSTDLIAYAIDGFPIYGPVSDPSILDGCNGRFLNNKYQYHVRTLDQVNGTGTYCNGNSPAINWKYVVGCYHAVVSKSVVASSATSTIPSDCVQVSYY